MRLLTIGDVVSKPGINMLSRHLKKIVRQENIDFVVVNGENASGVGITPSQADDIFDAGAHVITLGNHVFKKREIANYLEDTPYILRPSNMAPQLPGYGYYIYNEGKLGRILVINLIGRCDMQFGNENPFLEVERILKKCEGEYDTAICEIHTNATSEKIAMGFHLDGKVAVVYGTHTHVPTADIKILPKGTGYITDIGMTGPYLSVLGVEPAQSIAMFRGDLTEYFKAASGDCILSGAIFDIEGNKCTSATRYEIID